MFKLITILSFLIIFPIAAQGLQSNLAVDQTIKPAAISQPETTPSQVEWLKGSVAFREVSDWEGMLNWCQKWSKSEPKDASAWHCLGYSYQMLHHHDDAIAVYLRTVKINPEDIDGWSNLGFVYTEQNRYDEAINAYLKVLHINPEDIEALSNLLLVYYSSGKSADAQETLQILKRLNPEKANEVLEFVTPSK